jgi:hypothetical protein
MKKKTVKDLIIELQELKDHQMRVVIDSTPGDEWPTLRDISGITVVHEKDEFVCWIRR